MVAWPLAYEFFANKPASFKAHPWLYIKAWQKKSLLSIQEFLKNCAGLNAGMLFALGKLDSGEKVYKDEWLVAEPMAFAAAVKSWMAKMEARDLEYPGNIALCKVPVVESPIVCSFSLFDPSSPPSIPHVVSNINLFDRDVSKAQAWVKRTSESTGIADLVSYEPVKNDWVLICDPVVDLKL